MCESGDQIVFSVARLPDSQIEKFGCLQKTVLKSHEKPKLKGQSFMSIYSLQICIYAYCVRDFLHLEHHKI